VRKLLIALLSVLLMAQSLPAQAADTWTSCSTGLANTNSSVVTVDSSVSGKCIITFKSGQTFTIPVGVASIQEALVVGGGGGGGFNNNGGGGGGGEVKYRKTALSLSGITQLKITIGDGGLDGWISSTASTWTYGENGSPSSINDQNDNLIIRAGGGGGGCGGSNYREKPTFSGSAGGACSGGGSQPAGVFFCGALCGAIGFEVCEPAHG
jgi:fibronectin-binding autotransporter adhesin